MKIKVLVGLAAAMLLVPSMSQAAAPDGAGPWADFFQDVQQGQRKDGSPVLPERSDPTDALGVAERSDDPNSGVFFSLGFGGRITLGYENNICNGAGADMDIELVESTKEPHPPQLVDVFVSNDGVNFTQIASDVEDDEFIGLPPEFERVRFVRLVDVTRPEDHPNPASDGYDVDGVRALETDCDGPPPPPEGVFSCRASALRIDGSPLAPLIGDPFEPIVANQDGRPCETEDASLIALPLAGPPGSLTVLALHAATNAENGANAKGGVAEVTLRDAVGMEVLRLGVLNAEATGSCDNGEPALTGNSEVASLRISGNEIEIPPDDPATPEDESHVEVPLGPLGTIHVNEEMRTSSADETVLTRRAFWFEGSPLGDIIIGEAIADFSGDPCP